MFLHLEDEQRLTSILGYQFKNNSLLQQALTRKSGHLEGRQEKIIGHNERLEFLGDGIIRKCIDVSLFEIYSQANEAEMTDKRDKLVAKNGFLFDFSEKSNLENFIIMGKGEQKHCWDAGREKILSSVMEAIIAAIYLDSGKDDHLIAHLIDKYSGLQVLKDKGLLEAVEKNDLEAVNKFLVAGADSNAIHNASYPISCSISLEHGLPCWLESGVYAKKTTALEMAIRRLPGFQANSLMIIQTLLQHKADTNLINASSYSLLAETIIYYPKREDNANKFFPEICKLLCQHGADVNFRSQATRYPNHGFTPLELCIIFKDLKKLMLLLKYQADPNLKGHAGQTTLHLVAIYADLYIKAQQERAQYGRLFAYEEINDADLFMQMAEKLIAHGANANITDMNGKLPEQLTKNPALKNLLKSARLKASSESTSNLASSTDGAAHKSSFLCLLQ